MMAFRQETQECFPREIDFGCLGLDGQPMIFPAPEPAHERCSGGHTMPGVLGGWTCPCPCHATGTHDDH